MLFYRTNSIKKTIGNLADNSQGLARQVGGAGSSGRFRRPEDVRLSVVFHASFNLPEIYLIPTINRSNDFGRIMVNPAPRCCRRWSSIKSSIRGTMIRPPEKVCPPSRFMKLMRDPSFARRWEKFRFI